MPVKKRVAAPDPRLANIGGRYLARRTLDVSAD